MLNEYTTTGRGGDIIKISEALHEKKIAEIANMIDARRNHVKVVLCAGPSASGKTTFSKRLAVQLAVNGIVPHLISLDDYFVDRDQTPVDEEGNYDFESLGAIDVEFFNEQLMQLFQGEEVELPRFNFLLGRREPSGRKLRLGDGHLLIVEGIHGMNPGLMPHVKNGRSFRIFLSALTQISIDDHNHISTTDNSVITSYSIHYTKLYEVCKPFVFECCFSVLIGRGVLFFRIGCLSRSSCSFARGTGCLQAC